MHIGCKPAQLGRRAVAGHERHGVDMALVESPDREVAAPDHLQDIAQRVDRIRPQQSRTVERLRERCHHQPGSVQGRQGTGGKDGGSVALGRRAEKLLGHFGRDGPDVVRPAASSLCHPTRTRSLHCRPARQLGCGLPSAA